MYRDPALGRARAQRARARLISNFAIAPWVDRYAAIYRLVSRPTLAAGAVAVAQ
jgi:hypothetical protein